jgi:hypothetical protein
MTRPFIGIFNSKTQERIIREMNDEEYAQCLIDAAEQEAEQAEQPTD